MDYSILISIVGSMVLTPLLVNWWSRLSPPASQSEFDHLDPEILRARNGWMDHIATVLSIAGICVPLIVIYFKLAEATFWLLALGFGLMVLLPFAFVCAVTLPHGAQRFREYWRFYELQWGVGLNGIRWLYIPVALLGLVGFVMVIRGA